MPKKRSSRSSKNSPQKRLSSNKSLKKDHIWGQKYRSISNKKPKISIEVEKAYRSGVAPTARFSNCDYCQNHAIYRKIYILIVIWSISQTEYKGWILLFLMPSLGRVQWIGNWVKWPLQSEWMHIVVSKKMPSHKNISNISKWRHHMLFRDVYPIFC